MSALRLFIAQSQTSSCSAEDDAECRQGTTWIYGRDYRAGQPLRLSFDQFVDGRADRLAPPAIIPRQKSTLMQPMDRSVREACGKERTDDGPGVAAVTMLQQAAPYRRVDFALINPNGQPAHVLADAVDDALREKARRRLVGRRLSGSCLLDLALRPVHGTDRDAGVSAEIARMVRPAASSGATRACRPSLLAAHSPDGVSVASILMAVIVQAARDFRNR